MEDVPQLVVGECQAGKGSTVDQRAGVFSETIIGVVGLGEFFEANRIGKIFSLATAVGATLNTQTQPLGAGGTALVAINNPSTNTFAAVILRAFATMLAGASATPILPVWNYISGSTAITAAANATPICGLLGSQKSSMNAYVNTALTGSIAATFLRPFMGSFNDPRHAGAASETSAGVLVEETNGLIIVPPGVTLIANMAPAGAAVTGCVGFSWAEVPWTLIST